MTDGAMNRRALIGAALISAALPSSALGQQQGDPAHQETTLAKIRMTFGGKTMTATLYDNTSARDFASMLPLDLTIDDYSNNEKIAYLPRKLTEEGSGAGGGGRPGGRGYMM